ncbi:MAG TPA: PilZ domain-containing protein [Candidatus Acidoferrum sp.]|nr:PilZ domain-containing protein [Candidatus Acidoferrum sp.]
MAGVRRSGRISKRVPILLLGTDTSGRVFSEETQTLVLSRHGAGLLSRNKFAPDEVLTLRIVESGREADIRLVGKLGDDPRGNVYGVAFCNPDLDFWQIEFPPAADYTPERKFVDLECCFCDQRLSVEQTEIESDVFLASQMVLRFCQVCGQTTSWKLAKGKPSPPPAPKPSRPFDPPAQISIAPPAPPSFAPQVPAPQRSAYAASSVLDEIVPAAFLPEPTPVPVATAVAIQEPPAAPSPAPLPAFSGGGQPNRRRHVRTRVHFTACVRLNHANEEIVECDNISKGGLCFRSRKRYEDNAAIEVAVPFSPGQPAIFTPARIRRVEELPSLNLFRYGVAYA